MSSFCLQDKYQLNKPFNGTQSKGFSLLETTIAVAILVSTVLGLMGLSSQSIRSASVSRNTIIASNLAQEGLELIKVYRFNNKFAGKPWTQGLGSCNSNNGCGIDASDLDVKSCSSSCDFLKFDNSLKLYNYSSGNDTIFKRIINLIDVNNDEVKVRSSVQWTDKFGNQNVNLETIMLDW